MRSTRFLSRPRVLGLAIALLAALALAACGQASTSTTASAQPTSTATAPAPMATETPASSASASAAGADVHLEPASYKESAVTISAGQMVRFIDPAGTGGPHMLCLGHNQICATGAQGPAVLQGPGFRINAGDPTRVVQFTTPGMYEVTCTFHPLMNLIVTVR